MDYSTLLLGTAIGMLIAVIVFYITVKMDNKRIETKKTIQLDDITMPVILDLFKNYTVVRGYEFTDDHIIMTWKHEHTSKSRKYKRSYFETTEQFYKEWRKNEVEFYLNNTEIFTKRVYKKRDKNV